MSWYQGLLVYVTFVFTNNMILNIKQYGAKGYVLNNAHYENLIG